MLEYLHALSLSEPFSFFLLSQFATVPLLVCSVHFNQGLFLKYVAFFWFLHSFTGYACRINRRLLLLCFIHTHHYCYILVQLFTAWKIKDKSTADAPVLENVYLCWINNRPCKHLGTAPSLAKFFHSTTFVSPLLKRKWGEHTFAVKCFQSPHRLECILNFFVKRSRESKGYSS